MNALQVGSGASTARRSRAALHVDLLVSRVWVVQGSVTVPQRVPPLARDLILSLLRPEPHSRLGALGGFAVDICCHECARSLWT